MARVGRKTVAIGAAALLLVALASIWAMRMEPPAPSTPGALASPVTSPPPGPGAATASPAAATGLDDRFGFIVTSGSAIWIRPETDPEGRTTLTGRFFVASPDGTQLAFWRESGGTDELFVLPAADPEQERSVYPVPAGQQGIRIVWANDGSGLLITIQRLATASTGPTVLMSTLLTLDLRGATGATTLATLTDGRAHLPIAWDRASELAAAAESSVTSRSARAPVMETYLTVRTTGPVEVTRHTASDGFAIPLIVGSPDARYVYARTGESIRFWPLADHTAGGTFQAPGFTGRLLWRPGTSQVAWLAGSQLEAYDVSAERAVTLFRGVAQNP
ncbi:MAG: hypothetical protein ACRDM0_06330, partial [Thermoleophilaceae bacterium]